MRARSCFLALTWLCIAVIVGGVKAAAQYFSAVTDESDELAGDGTDGILGLAYPPISNLGQVRPCMCILRPQLHHQRHNDIHLTPTVLLTACNRTRSSRPQSRKAPRSSTFSRSSSRTTALSSTSAARTPRTTAAQSSTITSPATSATGRSAARARTLTGRRWAASRSSRRSSTRARRSCTARLRT